MLANAHSFKDKSDRLSDVNAGLFTYPVLMASDILLYDTEWVPVGKDQIQHIEIARDIASAFNNLYHSETFVLPQAAVQSEAMTIPGTDGAKMSKSYGNFIDIYLEEKKLKKVVMSIKTDSTPLEDPKKTEGDTTFELYSILATEAETEALKAMYEGGGFGYGQAKQMLFDKIMEKFAEPRARYQSLMANPADLQQILAAGAAKARKLAIPVLERVKKLTGF
jgi:tryptophanyl-tRNA synthetase